MDTPYHCAYQFLAKKRRGLLYSCSVTLSFLPKYVLLLVFPWKHTGNKSAQFNKSPVCSVQGWVKGKGYCTVELKVAFIQKVLILLSFPQTDEPYNFPELEF